MTEYGNRSSCLRNDVGNRRFPGGSSHKYIFSPPGLQPNPEYCSGLKLEDYLLVKVKGPVELEMVNDNPWAGGTQREIDGVEKRCISRLGELA